MKYLAILIYPLLSLLTLLTGAPAAAAPRTVDTTNEQLLLRLDSIIERNPELVKEKDARIARLKGRYDDARSNAERLSVSRQLYDEYVVYDSDSALFYASRARQLALSTSPGDYELLADCKMDEAFIYIVLGLYDQAMELMEGIETSRLSPQAKTVYYELMGYAHSMRAIYLHSNKEIWRADLDKANQYRDSLHSIHGMQADEWLWVPIALALDSEHGDIRKVDIERLRKVVEQASAPGRQNAINSYWLARYYKETGDDRQMVRYMTMAAIYDALIVNREIAAIQELAEYLSEHGQLNRAYNYLLYADAQANLYHNRYRLVSLTDVLPGVREAYRLEIEKRDRRLSLMVIVLAVLLVGLLASIFFIIMEVRKLRKTKGLLSEANDELNRTVEKRDEAIAELEKANTRLSDANGKLSEANDKLSEANKQKLSLLAYALKQTTDNIQALEDYRKKLLKKYKVKKIDDLGVLINDPELLKDQYNGFYEGFDKMILSLFPDFVSEFNASVGEEGKVSPEAIAKTKTLNTRLRIYALKRLGMTKSAEIANMLNVSIRTVYNNRSGSFQTSREEENTD